jgi:hypothetical protein
MKLLAWNLNHRAARRQIPSWIAAAINEQAPDILVLTEYVEGPDHDLFLDTLKASGLTEFSCTTQPGRENQVLIASRSTQRRYDLAAPNIHPSVPSNSLEVWLGSSELASCSWVSNACIRGEGACTEASNVELASWRS